MIHLDRNDRLITAPQCLEALGGLNGADLSRYSRDFEHGGGSPLQRRLAALHDVEPRRVVLGSGAIDLLHRVLLRFVRPGSRVLIPAASWHSYRSMITELGGVSVEYPVVEHPPTAPGAPAEYRVDVDALLALDPGSYAVLFIAHPNNPTGSPFPVERLADVLDRFAGVPTVIDRAYRGLSDDRPDASLDVVDLVGHRTHVLIASTFSKYYALAPVRIGYGLVGDDVRMCFTRAAEDLGYSVLAERVALAALDAADHYAAVHKALIVDRLALYDALAPFEEVRAYRSEANFVLVRFPARINRRLNKGLLDAGLRIKFLAEPGFAGCARISLGTPAENELLRTALVALLAELLS
jgi:histidinol-phosphate aminotransferase